MTTEKAVTSGVPAVLGGIIERGATIEGAQGIFNLIRQGGYDKANVSELADRIGDGSTSTLARGRGLLDSLLGDKAGPIAQAVSGESGMRPSSVSSLLGLSAPVLLGVLGKAMAEHGSSPSGLMALLASAGPSVARALPAGLGGVAGAAGLGGLAGMAGRALGGAGGGRGAVAPTRGPQAVKKELGMLPLLLLGLMVAVAAFVFLFRPNSVDDATRQAQEESATAVGDATQWGSGESVNKRRPGADRTADGVGAGADRGPEALGAADRGSEAAEAASDFARGAADGASTTGQRGQSGVGAAAEPAPMTLTLPNGAKVDVAAGSIGYELATFLANGDAGGLPKSFTFDHLNFDTGTTRLTADSKNTVEALAAILKAYPGAEVRLEGHTDDAGNPASNQRLSDARAQAVKARLSALGATNRMSASGYGQERPKAPNDTPEGRAENRRLELVVLKK